MPFAVCRNLKPYSRASIRSEGSLICPVRDFTLQREHGSSHAESVSDWMDRNYTKQSKNLDPWQIGVGGQMAKHLENDLNFDPPAVWEPLGLNFQPIPLSHHDFAKPVAFENSVAPMRKFIEAADDQNNTHVVWNGWPVYWQGSEIIQGNFPESTLLEPASALVGGIEFARRHRLGKPTYFEVLPGYEIWCQGGELGMPRRWHWESLIQRREIDGTKTVKDTPIDRFQLNAGTQDFAINVRMGGAPKYRSIEAKLPAQISKAAPILIHSQIRPTGGGVKISLAPREEPDLFGRSAQIALKWSQAEERNVSDLESPQEETQNYSYPFIIESSGNREARDDLKAVGIALDNGAEIAQLDLRLHQILVPSLENQFLVPFGGRPIEEDLSESVLKLIQKINEESKWMILNVNGPDNSASRWTRIACCLFQYACGVVQDAFFKQALRLDYPVGRNPQVNIRLGAVIYGFGRVCRKPEHLEAYLERVLADWNKLERAPWVLFWPFQKCLSYYGDPVRISSRLAYAVLQCAVEMLDRIIEEKYPKPKPFGQSHWLKWTLAAILYGLRRRELDHGFLNLDSGNPENQNLAKNLQTRLRDARIYSTKIPDLALKGISVLGVAPSLPELILRFLEARADETDIAIAGGIGLTS